MSDFSKYVYCQYCGKEIQRYKAGYHSGLAFCRKTCLECFVQMLEAKKSQSDGFGDDRLDPDQSWTFNDVK